LFAFALKTRLMRFIRLMGRRVPLLRECAVTSPYGASATRGEGAG
jgi:hypothetical protein